MRIDPKHLAHRRVQRALIVAVTGLLGACEADTGGSSDGGAPPASADADSDVLSSQGATPTLTLPAMPPVSPSGVPSTTPSGLPSTTPTLPSGRDAGAGIDSGISAECDAQLAKCSAPGPDLIRDCVAVVRHCVPVDASPSCRAQADKCEQGSAPLIDCPAVALVCP